MDKKSVHRQLLLFLVGILLTMEEDNKRLIPINECEKKDYICNSGVAYSKVITSHVSPTSSSVEWVNESFTKLDISCNATKIEPDVIPDDKYISGYVINIISNMGIVLIQPFLPNHLLYLDTPLFLYDPNPQIQNSTNYIYLGKIDDILGSVNEPRYSVYPTLETINVLNIGDKVYSSPSNPDTQIMYVERTLHNNYKIMKKKMIIK